MSQENVELLRRAYEDWNAGGLDVVLHLLDPGIEWRSSGVRPDPESFRGHDGVRPLVRPAGGGLRGRRFVPEEIVARIARRSTRPSGRV